MKIQFRDFIIDTELFEAPVYVRDFDLIAFTTRSGLMEQQLTLNLCFEAPEAARKTFFSIRNSIDNNVRRLDLTESPCTWPKNLAKMLDSYITL